MSTVSSGKVSLVSGEASTLQSGVVSVGSGNAAASAESGDVQCIAAWSRMLWLCVKRI